MYLRFVKVKIRPDKASDFQDQYDHRISPELMRTPGCLFAALMCNEDDPLDATSMTIWDTRADAERYERSGVYHSILDEARPFIEETDEWKMRLQDAQALLERHHSQEPEVSSFPIQTGDPDQIPEVPDSKGYYLRIVSARVKPGELYRMISAYEGEVIPALLEVDGCHTAFLARGHTDPQHVLSITLWDSPGKARAYETSGRYAELVEIVRPYLTSFSSWQMALDPNQPDEPEAADLDVGGWQVVSSNEFATVKAG